MVEQKAYVYISQNEKYIPLGVLLEDTDRSQFYYARSWLANPKAFSIAPDMPLRQGFFTSRKLHNVFRDHCPDRWGRKLMGILANKLFYMLTDFEVLTAVHSPYRMGALAFGPTPNGPASMAPWAKEESVLKSMEELREFQKAIYQIDMEDDELESQISNLDVVRKVMEGSSSLGGGRPKALANIDGKDWIVKFNRKDDKWDETAIEYASMQFAKQCGINVANCQILRDARLGSAIMVERFDRDGARTRHMVSAFTLMEWQEDSDWGSYQQIAENCHARGSLRCGTEVFRRMVFNALIGNRDDHPRNHAFFYEGKAELTPAYDLVPSVHASNYLALNCGNMGRIVSNENLLSNVAPFGLNVEQAEQIIFELELKFKKWPEFFADCGVCDKDLQSLEKSILSTLPNGGDHGDSDGDGDKDQEYPRLSL